MSHFDQWCGILKAAHKIHDCNNFYWVVFIRLTLLVWIGNLCTILLKKFVWVFNKEIGEKLPFSAFHGNSWKEGKTGSSVTRKKLQPHYKKCIYLVLIWTPQNKQFLDFNCVLLIKKYCWGSWIPILVIWETPLPITHILGKFVTISRKKLTTLHGDMKGVLLIMACIKYLG